MKSNKSVPFFLGKPLVTKLISAQAIRGVVGQINERLLILWRIRQMAHIVTKNMRQLRRVGRQTIVRGF